jgi:hypothetical protein
MCIGGLQYRLGTGFSPVGTMDPGLKVVTVFSSLSMCIGGLQYRLGTGFSPIRTMDPGLKDVTFNPGSQNRD